MISYLMNPEWLGGTGRYYMPRSQMVGYVQIVKKLSELEEFLGMLQLKLFVSMGGMLEAQSTSVIYRTDYRVGFHAQSCKTLCDSMDDHPPGSSVHGISQARMLEWVAISSSRGSPGIKLECPVSPTLAGRIFTTEPSGSPQ